MRTLFKLLVVALILHAAYRVGHAYWLHYQFQDAIQQLAQFSESATEQEVRRAVLDLAAERDVPLSEEALTVTRQPRRIQIEGSYTRSVEVLPRYALPWSFDLDVTVVTLN